jgi:predicted nucleic acid-binding protein
VDTNCIISALLRKGAAHSIFLRDIRFYAPSFSLRELAPHREFLLHKSGLGIVAFEQREAMLLGRITFISDEHVALTLPLAKKIMDPIDPQDAPFLALALRIPNDGIWSDDKHLQMQHLVTVWTTADLMNLGGNPPSDQRKL